MECRELEAVIEAGEAVPAALADDARAHLSSCAACRDLAELYGFTIEAQARRQLPHVSEAIYLRERVLGVGGMGTTYAGWDVRLERPVAIKEPNLKEGDARADELVARFTREAKLTARLQHPAIVTVYEAGYFGDQPGERPFYTMEPIEGHPLDIEIATRRTLEDRLKLLPQVTTVANAVAYAHEHGVVHRDIKPANILIGQFGEAVLIDWGLAKELDEVDAALDESAGLLTRMGAGTPNYMPPEQAMGGPAEPRVDVYALGATLYHLVCGTEPYHEASSTEVRKRLFAGPPTPCTEIEPRAPRELVAIIHKAMAREPGERFANAGALARELSRYQSGQLVESYRHSWLELVVRWIKRHRGVVAVTTFALVAVGVIAGIAIGRILDARTDALAAQQRAEASEQHTRHLLTASLEQHGRVALAYGRARDFTSAAESFARALADDPRTATRVSAARALQMAATAPQTNVLEYGRSIDQIAALTGDDIAVVVAGSRLVVTDVTVRHKRWHDFTGEQLAIAALPSGDAIAVGTAKGRAFLVPAAHLDQQSELEASAGAQLTCMAVSPDGRWIAACDAKQDRVLVWNASSRKLAGSFRSKAVPTAVAVAGDRVFWAQDGREVLTTATIGAPSDARDLPTGDSPDLLQAVRANHRGTRLATADAGGARIWDPTQRSGPLLTLLMTIGPASIETTDVAFSPDDAMIVGLHAGAIDFWRTDRDELVGVFVDDLETATVLTYTRSGAVVVGDMRGFLRVWRTPPTSTTLERYEPRTTEYSLAAVHLAPDIAVVANQKSSTARILWLDHSRPPRVISTAGVVATAISEDGCTVGFVTHTAHSAVERYDICGPSPRPLAVCAIPDDFDLAQVLQLELSSTFARIYGYSGWLDACAGPAVRAWAPGATAAFPLESGGKYFAVVYRGAPGIYTSDGRKLAACDAQCAGANTYYALPDERGILVLSGDRLLRLDFATGATSYLMQLPSEARESHAVSRDGSTLAISDSEGLVRFIDLDAKEQMFEIMAAGDSADKVVLDEHPLSALLISDDGTVRRLPLEPPADLEAVLSRLRDAGIDGKLPP